MKRRDFLVEIGTEELPPKSLAELSRAFTAGVVAGLATAELAHGLVTPFATPRRLAVRVARLVERQPDQQIRRKELLEVAQHERRPVGLLVLQGYVDSMDSMALERAIDEIYAQDVFYVVLDVTQESHISSAGWSVIVSKLSLLGEKRGYFRFAGMRHDVLQVFRLVGFENIAGIEVHDCLEEAFRACRATVQHVF